VGDNRIDKGVAAMRGRCGGGGSGAGAGAGGWYERNAAKIMAEVDTLLKRKSSSLVPWSR
jgi:hypothetical protein